MKALAALSLVALFASPAWAQTRQPAQMTTLPATSPQEFDLLDNTGKWLPFGSGANGVFLDTTRSVSPAAFGAKCDGVTDDTTALQAWAAATTDRAHLVVPGVCVFKAQIAFPPTVYGVTIEGNGHPGKLLYAGASTTLDPIIQIGARGVVCPAKGWAIKGLHFMSSTKMTAGDALRISGACNMQIDDLTIGGNLDGGNGNFFNALHLDGGNSVYTRGFGLWGSNAGLTVNGDVNLSRNFTDPMFLHGYVAHSRIGIHICGAVGGFVGDDMDVLQNGTNVLIDQACAAKANLGILFGPHFESDATDPVGFPAEPNIGVHVADPGANNEIIIYRGWLASATNQCFAIDNMAAPTVSGGFPIISFMGAMIGGCHAPVATTSGGAIDNQNLYWTVNVSGTTFFVSQGATRPTIYNAPGALPMSIQSITPDTNFSISGLWGGSYRTFAGEFLFSDTSSGATSMDLDGTNNPNGFTLRLDGNGVTTPKKYIRSGNGSLQFFNDAGTPIMNLFDPGVLSTPIGFTIGGTLPTCNASLKGGMAYVSNAQATPSYLGAVSTTGSTIAPVFCTGVGWVYH